MKKLSDNGSLFHCHTYNYTVLIYYAYVIKKLYVTAEF